MKNYERLMILGFSLLALFFCLKGNMDTDLFWHMTTGRWILENWQFPSEDTFSYIYSGARWIDITWLFQITTHLAMHFFDYIGVLLICATLYIFSAVLTWFSFRNIHKQDPSFFIWVIYCLLFVWLERRWLPRPETGTHFFLALEILILIRFCLKPEKSRSLWFVPLIMALWANTHGMFILGLILFGMIVLRFPRKTLAPFIVSALATLLNPYGWDGATYPFYLRRVSADPVYRLIQEGMSFMDSGVTWEWYTLWGIWMVLLLFSVRTGFRVMGWVYFAWMAFAIYFSTTMVRNLSPSVLMTAPFILAGLESIWTRWVFSWKLRTPKFVGAWVLGTTLVFCSLVVSGSIDGLRDNFHFGWKITENETLENAAKFYEKNIYNEKIFATPEFNNYMMWKDTAYRTYIDTRYAEVVPKEHFQKMFQLFLNPQQIEQETMTHKLPVVAINHTLANYHGAIRYFLSSPNWRAVYADHFMIFFFHQTYKKDFPEFKIENFNSFLSQQVEEWKAQPFYNQDKTKKIYQIFIAATLFGQNEFVLNQMSNIEDKMDLKLNNLYCSILTYSARILPEGNPTRTQWASKAVKVCEDVFYKVVDQSSAFNRATAAFILGDFPSALEWVERAFKFTSTVYSYYILKAEILTAQDAKTNFVEIEKNYKESLRLNPFQEGVWVKLVQLQEKYGSPESVNESRKQVQRFYPQLNPTKSSHSQPHQ